MNAPRKIIPEHIPKRSSLRTARTRREQQGWWTKTCMAFGITTALETAMHRAGLSGELAARFLWYFAGRPTGSDVRAMVRAAQNMGICRDDLWPYDPNRLDEPPSDAAIKNAAELGITFGTVSINGREEICRAIAQGSPVTIITVGLGGSEHCECADEFDEHGLGVVGSYGELRTIPWGESRCITQAFRYVDLPWPLIPDDNYIEGDLPEYNAGALWLPKLTVFKPWPAEPEVYTNALVHFTDANTGTLVEDDPDVRGFDATWSSTRRYLALPSMLYFNPVTGLWDRCTRVSALNPSVEIVSFTKA